MDSDKDARTPPPGGGDLASTAVLLARIRAGDREARDHLVSRYLPVLKRWAHGRLPRYARDLADTDDLVQVTLLRALEKLDEFEIRREGAFLAYLRTILMNQVRDQIRRATRRPIQESLSRTPAADGRSPLEELIGKQAVERYEKALATLPEEHRQAVLLRVEFGYSHREIAEALGSPSANAARMQVARAIVRLTEAMDE